MNFNFSLFFCALGLAAVLEALPWILAPDAMRDAFLRLAELPARQGRAAGFVILALGLLLCAAGRSFS